MVRFALEFESGNEAFGQAPRDEVVRILRQVADKIEGGREGGYCVDINGNSVGTFDMEVDEGESD